MVVYNHITSSNRFNWVFIFCGLPSTNPYATDTFFIKVFQLKRLSATKTFNYKDFQLNRLSATKTFSYKDFQLQRISAINTFSYKDLFARLQMG